MDLSAPLDISFSNTDGSAQGNPGPVGSGIVIKKQGLQSSPIKLAKTVTPHGSSYAGELEAIKL